MTKSGWLARQFDRSVEDSKEIPSWMWRAPSTPQPGSHGEPQTGKTERTAKSTDTRVQKKS
jgi:hypothetical protein